MHFDKRSLIKHSAILLDHDEFLAPYGIRSLSKYHQEHPYVLKLADLEYCINYQSGEDRYRLMAGGNSNWRGPVWFPLNYLTHRSIAKIPLLLWGNC